MTTDSPAAVIVLAAGAGTRMKSTTPKVLHTLAGRSILGHSLAAARGLNPGRMVVVVRHERDLVAQEVGAQCADAIVVDQDDIPGTGRAVQCGLSSLDAVAHASAAADGGLKAGAEVGVDGAIVVVAGDVPLLDTATLGELLAEHNASSNAVTILTTRVPDATGYGRILRDPQTGDVTGIVEHRDATPEQLAVQEINSSIYVFDATTLRGALTQLGTHNAQGEVYLTDVIAIARGEGKRVRAVITNDPMLVEGVNDRAQLAVLRAELNRRILDRHMRAGVTVIDPTSTWVDTDVEIEPDVTIHPGTNLHGTTAIATGAEIGPDTTLTDTEVGEHARVIRTHAELAVVGPDAVVGPFSYLRPGSRLATGSKIGAFVEVKNASIGEGAKVPHLSYVGDASVGEHTNIGAGTIFVNYDGVNKHHTQVGAYARTGANNMFVAPVTIGDGAYTGAGSVIRRDVPAGSLGVSSGPQRNIEDWVHKRRAGTEAAEAAELAQKADGSDRLGPQARLERETHQPTTPRTPSSATTDTANPIEGDSAR